MDVLPLCRAIKCHLACFHAEHVSPFDYCSLTGVSIAIAYQTMPFDHPIMLPASMEHMQKFRQNLVAGPSRWRRETDDDDDA